MRQPRLCKACQVKPVGLKSWFYCYDCKPGGPYTPPPCRRCGSTTDYYTAGVCGWCHCGGSFRVVDSCRDCLAWGVTRTHRWLCHACIGWREHNPTIGGCLVCGRRRHIGRGGFCRLCWRTAATAHRGPARNIGRTYIPVDVVALNRDGQQLFLANTEKSSRRRSPRTTLAPPADAAPGALAKSAPTRARHRQPPLFDNRPPSWMQRHGITDARDTRTARALDSLAGEVAARHGWSHTSTKRVRLNLKVLLGQRPPGQSLIRATDVDQLLKHGLVGVDLTRMVLTEAGLLDDDRTPAVDRWAARTLADLPEPMATEMGFWFQVLRYGSPTPPRSRPRAAGTIRTWLSAAMPTLQHWAAGGHNSLREISRADVLAALPADPTTRPRVGGALRSIFRTLKAHGLVFVNPTARITIAPKARRPPLPADLAAVRGALVSPDPATALLAALLAFHGIRAGALRALHLTDIRDGRLHLDGRVIPLGAPVRPRLAAYLDHRARRWPGTANPHLFIHHRTACQTGPVGARWLSLKLGMAAAVLREDRILDEAHATGGDIRRLCDLFGISVKAASRYTTTVDHPALAVLPGPATHDTAES